NGMNDLILEFGQSLVGPGKAFYLGDEDNGAFVGKTWTKVDQSQFLIEAVRQSELAQMLAKLPQGAGAKNPGRAVRGLVQRKLVAGRAELLAQGAEKLKGRQKTIQTAAIRLGRAPIGQGVVLDYTILGTTTNFEF